MVHGTTYKIQNYFCLNHVGFKMNYLCNWSLVWMSFKLKLVIIQPILEPLSFSHKFGIFVCIIDSLHKESKYHEHIIKLNEVL